MRRISFVAALAAVAAAPLSAQTWQNIGVPSNSNTGAYWNNKSDDNNPLALVTPVCNVGAILSNTPSILPGACNNQAPVFLPIAPVLTSPTSQYLDGVEVAGSGGFRFVGGRYNFGVIGRVAGAMGNWGVISDAGVVFGAAALVGGPVSITGPFALWIEQSRPLLGAGTVYSSAMTTGVGALAGRAMTSNQQFAVFTGGSTGSLLPGGLIDGSGTGSTYYVGMEDNTNCGPRVSFGACAVPAAGVADRDYNDIIVSIQAVPEPATIGLMAFGLLALAGVAKRRKA